MMVFCARLIASKCCANFCETPKLFIYTGRARLLMRIVCCDLYKKNMPLSAFQTYTYIDALSKCPFFPGLNIFRQSIALPNLIATNITRHFHLKFALWLKLYFICSDALWAASFILCCAFYLRVHAYTLLNVL